MMSTLTERHMGRRRIALFLLLLATVVGSGGCLREYIFQRLKPDVMPAAVAPKPLVDVSAKSCGACHMDIYAEWSQSMMAKAYTDPVFQDEWAEENNFYYCLNCHAPLQQQQPHLIDGLEKLKPPTGKKTPNPSFDAALQAEGVTCVVCHLKDGHMEGPIETSLAPHPVRVVPDFSSEERCAHCHQLPPVPFSKEPRSLSDLNNEWLTWVEKTGDTRSCVDCHMAPVTRPLVPGFPPREGRSHRFPGAWDDAFSKGAATISQVVQEGRDVVVSVTNHVGHGIPTGGNGRSLALQLTYTNDAGTLLDTQTYWFERIKAKKGQRPQDSTLRPAETRDVRFTPPSGSEAPQQVTVRLILDRLKQHKGMATRLGWEESRVNVELDQTRMLLPVSADD
jgi:hypothetical protein